MVAFLPIYDHRHVIQLTKTARWMLLNQNFRYDTCLLDVSVETEYLLSYLNSTLSSISRPNPTLSQTELLT